MTSPNKAVSIACRLVLISSVGIIVLLNGCDIFSPSYDPVYKEKIFLGKSAGVSVKEVRSRSVKQNMQTRMQVGNVVQSDPPASYPSELSWKPYRHFGPFYAGSELSDIKILLSSKLGTMYYGDYLSGHTDTSIFQKYFGSPLPATATTDIPAPSYAPGTFPSYDGAHDLRMELQRIRYTSRYGGSIELFFRNYENYDGELKKGNIRWDVESLYTHVYVQPDADLFNPNYPPTTGNIYVEIIPQGITAYNGTSLEILQDNNEAGLKILLKEIATNLVNNINFRQNAIRFAHGFVHVQFKEQIGVTDKVSMVEITDDFFLPHTRQGEPLIAVGIRIRNIFLNTEVGDEEIVVRITAEHAFKTPVSVENPNVVREFDPVDSGEGTPSNTLGVFTIDECRALKGIIFQIDVTESDDFVDDYYNPSLHEALLNCDTYENLANSGQWGKVSENTTVGVIITDDTIAEGSLSYTILTSLYLR